MDIRVFFQGQKDLLITCPDNKYFPQIGLVNIAGFQKRCRNFLATVVLFMTVYCLDAIYRYVK